MSDNRDQDPRFAGDSDAGEGTRVASIAPASIPPVSVSVNGGESGRNIVIGALLNHTYRVEALLARGGMGEVYRATHVELGTEHAIKVILPELTENTRVVDMFRREAASLRNVRDDAVVAYDGVFRDEHGRLYLVMEFVSGPSLSDRLRQGALNPEEVLMLRDRIAGGLAAAHEKGIVHRDMSPDNVILPGGRLEHAKILDFGIAKLTDPDAKTIIGDDFAGKYSYVSPEQLGMFGGTVDGRSDIYSVGLVLAAAVRGRPLDMGMSPLAVVEARRAVPDLSEFPEAVRAPLEHMLQPDPKDRPQTMAEIIGARGDTGPAHSARGEDSAATPASRRDAPARQRTQAPPAKQKPEAPARQRASVVGLAAGVGVATMLAGGLGYYFLLYNPSGDTVQASRSEPPRLTPAAPPQLSPATPPALAAPQLSPATPLTPVAPQPSAPASLTPAPQLTPAAPAPPSLSAPAPSTLTASPPEPPPVPALSQPAPSAALPVTSVPAAPVLPAAPSTSTTNPAAPATARIAPPAAPPAPPLPQTTASPPPADARPSDQLALVTPPPVVQPTTPAPSTPAVITPPPSAAEIRSAVDKVLRNFSCARLAANPVNGVWTVSGFVSTPQDLRRLNNDLASAGVPSPRVEAEIFQRPLCEVAELLHTSTAVRRDDAALRIGLNSPNRSYRDGDQLVVDVTSQIPAERFLYVSYVDKEGNILHLLPKPGSTDNKAPAGRTFRFGQNKEYMISPPHGTDMVIALASPVRLFDSARPEEETSAKYFGDLQATLRKHNPGGPTGSIVSNYILINTSP